MIDSVLQFGRQTFSSLVVRNYRIYFIGQAISMGGSWMQTVALGWLVLVISGSGVQLGSVVAMQFIPILLFGAWGGVMVDRYHKLRFLYWTNTAFLVLVGTITVLIYTESVSLWMLYVFAFAFGMVRVFDNPLRQAFVSEMVGTEHVRNAVSLNAIANNSMRAIGPSIAGIIIASTSIALCFLLNALTYVAVLIMLTRIRREQLHSAYTSEKKSGQLMEGLRYVLATPVIRNTLIMMGVIGTFAYEFQVSLPLLASNTFASDATGYAALLTAMGIGSGVGGLYAASRKSVDPQLLIVYAFLFGVSIIVTALMPTLAFATIGMLAVGLFSINLLTMGNSMIQLESTPQMRGRVLALWSVAMIGSTTIGGPIVGSIGEHAGPRWGLALGGIATLIVAAVFTHRLWKERRLKEDIPAAVPDSFETSVQS